MNNKLILDNYIFSCLSIEDTRPRITQYVSRGKTMKKWSFRDLVFKYTHLIDR